MRNKVDGHVTIKELLEYAQCNVDIWLSDPVLWDLSNATLRDDSSLVDKRKGGKTTFVAPDPLTYGMLRMAITTAECNESHFIASIYSDIKEAEAWLKET